MAYNSSTLQKYVKEHIRRKWRDQDSNTFQQMSA